MQNPRATKSGRFRILFVPVPGVIRANRQTARGEEGATLVEFAISASILLSLVFGIIGISMALYTYHYVAYAARAGTRYAIVRGATCSLVLSGCPGYGSSNSVDVQLYLRSIVYPGIDPNLLTVNTTFPDLGSPSCTPNVNPCDNPGNRVKVQVTYQFPLSIPFIPPSTLSMSSTSQMVISQ